MKKYIHVPVVLALIFLIDCSGEKAEDTEQPPDGIDLQVESKNITEVPSATEPQIVCDRFELVCKVAGSTFDISIDTDLPDNTVIMVSVSRSYLEKGNASTYSLDYFSDKSTVGEWKSKQGILIDNKEWETTLGDKQEEMAGLGLGFDVSSISDTITVRMVVPIKQPDPKFGEQNQNLSGKAVSTHGIRVVEDEIDIDYPLNTPPEGNMPFPGLDPLKLKVGNEYVVSRQTPLMPSHSLENPIKAMQKMIQIPKGGAFKIIDVYNENMNLWYKVTAFDQRTEQIKTGWINSSALLGQKLYVVK